MIEDTIKKEYLYTYYGKAKDLATWFNAGLMNLKVAELLLQKYNSSHKRLKLEEENSIKPFNKIKRRRINPYHLVLHRYILMFFGLALECYLKGLLVKIKKINPLNLDGVSLSQKIIRHLSTEMFKDAIGTTATAKEADTISRLRRAILSGKYPIEKKVTQFDDAYTAYLNLDIKETKNMIKKAKKKWNEHRFRKK